MDGRVASAPERYTAQSIVENMYMSIEDWFNKSISRKDFFKTSAKGAAAGAAVTLISPAKMVEAFQERRTEDTTFVPKEKNGFLDS